MAVRLQTLTSLEAMPSDATEGAAAYSFGGYCLDAATLELRGPLGIRLDASPTVVELLLYLVRNRARVVTKDELTARLWPDVVVNENALAQHIWAARKAVGDAGSEQRIIKNVRGRGYRWVTEVEEALAGTPRRRPSSPPSGGEAFPGPPRDFVGREEELAWFTRSVVEAASGEGRICLVGGDAGIGKTRLLQEVRRIGAAQGFTDAEGRCHDDEGMPPFWPWKQALADVERRLGDEALRRAVGTDGADLSRLIPSLKQRLGVWSAPPPRESDDDRYYLFQAVTDFLIRAAGEQPQLLTLDDLHWADLPSLQLLKFLSPHVGAARLGIVGAYRGNELTLEHGKLLESTARAGSVRKLSLRGLPVAAIALLLQRSGRPETPGSAERIHTLTGGNPLFVSELGRGGDDEPVNASEGGSPPSAGLSRTLARRLSVLRPACRAVAKAASVLGHDFRLADLRRVSREPVEELMQLLGILVEQRIVTPDAGHVGAYRFTHPLVRDAVYRTMADGERARLHAAVAHTLEELPPEQRASRIDEVAHHYFTGIPSGTASKAAEYAGQVAERAYQGAAFEEAVRLYRRGLEALDLSDLPDPGQRDRLLLGLGHALRGAAEPADIIRGPFTEVAERAARTGNAKLFAEAALAYAGNGPIRLRHLTEMGVVDPGEVSYLSRANALLGPADSEQKTLVLSLLARALYHAPDPTERDALARDSVAMARRVGHPRLIAQTLLVKQQVLRSPHSLPERIGDLAEAVQIADAIGARELQIDARHERAWAYLELARLEEAEADVHRIGRLADELQQPNERRFVDLWELSFAYIRDNVNDVEARDRARYMHRKTARTGQAYGVRLLMARYLQDRADETIPLLEGFARQFPLPGSWHCALASTYATVGRMEDAHRELEAIARTGYSAVPRTHDWLASFVFLANAAQLLGNKQRGAEIRDVLAPFENNIVVLGVGSFIGSMVSRVLGDLHRLLGDVKEAERCYDLAMIVAEKLASPALIGWIQVDRAELYLRCEGHRDRPRAAALLRAATPVVESHGIALLGRRVNELAKDLRASSGTFESPYAAVSERRDNVVPYSRGARGEPEGPPPTKGSAGETKR